MTFKYVLAIGAAALLSLTPALASAHGTGFYHQHENNNDDDILAGAAIGAVAGGLLGSQIAGSGARTEGTALGAVLGGVAGAAIADSNSNSRSYHTGSRNNYYRRPSHYNNRYYSNRYRDNRYYTSPHYYRSYSRPHYSRTTTRYHYDYNDRPHFARPTYRGGYYDRPDVTVTITDTYRSSPRYHRHSHGCRH